MTATHTSVAGPWRPGDASALSPITAPFPIDAVTVAHAGTY
jgi:hypothetical protein